MTHRFVDTHCHFDFPPFTGDEVPSIERAEGAGVEGIIVNAIEEGYWERVLDRARGHDALLAGTWLQVMSTDHSVE